jgi:hypothetical protein
MDRSIHLTLLGEVPELVDSGYGYAKTLRCIYRSVVEADLVDTFTIQEHLWQFRKLSHLLSVSYPVAQLQQQSSHNPLTHVFPFNRYLSKGITITHNRTVFGGMPRFPNEMFDAIAWMYQTNRTNRTTERSSLDREILDTIRVCCTLSPKQLRLVCQGYCALYHQKLTMKRFLIDTHPFIS